MLHWYGHKSYGDAYFYWTKFIKTALEEESAVVPSAGSSRALAEAYRGFAQKPLLFHSFLCKKRFCTKSHLVISITKSCFSSLGMISLTCQMSALHALNFRISS